ncbi:unnamed protein product [Rhodiola kirilowii]
MADVVKQMVQIIAKQITLGNQVVKSADAASVFRRECGEIKYNTIKLLDVLRQAVRVSFMYERPTRRIIEEIEVVLLKAYVLVRKCGSSCFINRLFTIGPAASFRKISARLENSIGDVSWLLRFSAPVKDRWDDIEYVGLPPIAVYDPVLCLIWEQIAILCNGSVNEKSDAAESLVLLARDSDWYACMIVKEGGVGPLLKLMMMEWKPEAQEIAARAIGLLARDQESVHVMIRAGVCSALAKILKEGPMRVQAVAAWAVSKLAGNYPKCQDIFASNNVIKLLVRHLAFETLEENYKYAIVSKANLIHAVEDEEDSKPRPIKNNGRDQSEDPATKATMKAMAARALWNLAKDNPSISRSISESKALLCFGVLLEKGTKDIQFNCAMAMMVITAVAEKDMDLGKSVFKSSSSACKAVVDQLLIIIEKGDQDLLIPCISAIGNLAGIFRATETRIIPLLVKFLDHTEAAVCLEASIALTKFACTENYLHVNHSKAILSAGGAPHLVLLAYVGEKLVQIQAVILLSYISLHVPDSGELVKNEVLNVLGWALSHHHSISQNQILEALLLEARSKLELYLPIGWKFY